MRVYFFLLKKKEMQPVPMEGKLIHISKKHTIGYSIESTVRP